MAAKRAKNDLERNRALAGRPEHLPVIASKEEGDGELRVTVRLQTKRWQRWVGVPERLERDFVLDPYGREVYDACDGKRNVRAIVGDFAKSHHISVAEAERAVTTYLKTLMTKGLVAVAIDRGKRKK